MAFLNRDETSNLSKTFKQKKEEARKASEAGGNTKAWNSLFMRQDTVRFSCFKNASINVYFSICFFFVFCLMYFPLLL